MKIDFIKPIFFGKPISVLFRIKNINKSRQEIHFDVVSALDPTIVHASGNFTQIVVDPKTKEKVRVPNSVRSHAAALESNKDWISLEEYFEKYKDVIVTD